MARPTLSSSDPGPTGGNHPTPFTQSLLPKNVFTPQKEAVMAYGVRGLLGAARVCTRGLWAGWDHACASTETKRSPRRAPHCLPGRWGLPIPCHQAVSVKK